MPAEPPVKDNADDELIELWQDQELEGEKMSIEGIRNRARAFERRILWRNVGEYVPCVIILAVFGREMVNAPNWPMAVGCALILVGTTYVAYSLRSRGSSQRLLDEMGRETYLAFYRASLERQRDLLLDIWRSYLLPFVPGIILTAIGAALRDGLVSNSVWTPEQSRQATVHVVIALVLSLVFFAVADGTKRAARKLQSQIDELKE